MEIHAPDKPILTVKEAAVHLLIVTVGILIALSLEGVVEYAHHRSVVRDARGLMRQEIAANQKELESALAHMQTQEKDLADGVDLLASMVRGVKPDKINIPLNYQAPDLHAADV